ncbi:stage II sporulation protein D [Alkalihalobacillus sp. 1P02AB]|uniref:stage II sporulation protein D n=1 Tax=Alkalihalobacillus sp. 1P02AB TaxID=3132260 RepID=UPI0039A506CA
MRRLLITGIILCTVVLFIPTMLVLLGSSSTSEQVQSTEVAANPAPSTESNEEYRTEDDVTVAVYRNQTTTVEQIPLEEYVIGVVGSEMHASFEVEALKAQSLAARTYVLQYMMNEEHFDFPEGAVVTDTTNHQVYQDNEQLKEKWGADFEQNYAKVREAVLATKGEILTYDDQPIDAQFFSTSNGYTENSEDYWGNETPYLKSVTSPWDQESPRFSGVKTMNATEFESKLKVSLPADGTVGTIVSRTDGGRVAKAQINGKEISGRVIRDELGLDSSDFQWQRQGDEIIIQTRGWGHGVGMSQYGANGMALEGKTYEEIVHYYYKDVTIQSTKPFVEQYVAKNS